MTKRQLMKRIAQLESIQDQLSTELSHLDDMLRLVGFPDGLNSAKAIAQEIVDELNQPSDQEE